MKTAIDQLKELYTRRKNPDLIKLESSLQQVKLLIKGNITLTNKMLRELDSQEDKYIRSQIELLREKHYFLRDLLTALNK